MGGELLCEVVWFAAGVGVTVGLLAALVIRVTERRQ